MSLVKLFLQRHFRKSKQNITGNHSKLRITERFLAFTCFKAQCKSTLNIRTFTNTHLLILRVIRFWLIYDWIYVLLVSLIMYSMTKVIDAWIVSVFVVILVRIFPHLFWIRRDTPYSVGVWKNEDQNNSE